MLFQNTKTIFSILLFLSISLSGFAQTIHYKISFPAPQTHYAKVEIEVNDIPKDKESLDFVMPVWAPGSYLIREFAKGVESVTSDASITKTSKNVWRVETKGKSSVKLMYDVYGFEHSVRTSFIDASHAALIPTSIFMYVDGMKNETATLEIEKPSYWKTISTSLKNKDGKENTFEVPNYDILADSPIEIGNQEILTFEAAGVKHSVVMYGQGNYNKGQITKDMAKVVEAATKVWGENPAEDYKFIVHNSKHGGGGLEHLNSTSLVVDRMSYGTERGYLGFLGLVAHEYFHLWNVKRLRPFALTNYDYTQEQNTNLLWIFEGFTSYYDELLLTRAGFVSEEGYLKTLSGNISATENKKGRHVQPVTEASFDAWIKAYRPNENSGNTTVSYYGQGSVYAAMLDLMIIEATDAEKNLDDVMRYLYNEYYKKQKRGFTDAEFQAAVGKIAGKPFPSFFENVVYGTQMPDYATYLGYAGLKLMVGENKSKATLGIRTIESGNNLIVRSTERDGAAYKQGLNVNDEVISADGFRVTSNGELSEILHYKNVGDEVELVIARDGLLQNLTIKLEADDTRGFEIQKIDNPSKKQQKVYKKWMEKK
ncbi:M61 family metallopeptidase [Bernardetia sp.]|uniref:M61 family metallopeptidase n=1 Tax=Bernardetia sp. TaxID=1937974 RepID=UPI0025BEB7F2|nr:PDZ domain-containing protein [Bernardetia sp.]